MDTKKKYQDFTITSEGHGYSSSTRIVSFNTGDILWPKCVNRIIIYVVVYFVRPSLFDFLVSFLGNLKVMTS